MISKDSLLYKYRTQTTYNDFCRIYDLWRHFNLEGHYITKLQEVYNKLPQDAKLFVSINYTTFPSIFKHDPNILMAAL